MKLTVLESAAWNDRVLNGDFDMAMLNGYQGPDPDAMSKRIGTGGVANYSMYSNAEVDELLAKARSLTKDEERGECYRRHSGDSGRGTADHPRCGDDHVLHLQE